MKNKITAKTDKKKYRKIYVIILCRYWCTFIQTFLLIRLNSTSKLSILIKIIFWENKSEILPQKKSRTMNNNEFGFTTNKLLREDCISRLCNLLRFFLWWPCVQTINFTRFNLPSRFNSRRTSRSCTMRGISFYPQVTIPDITLDHTQREVSFRALQFQLQTYLLL